MLFKAALQWVRHDPSNRRKELCEILPCIRLQFLDPSFLKCVMDEDDFTQPDMERCREYIEHEIEKLTSHRYCRLPPHREPIKPLVICKFHQFFSTLLIFRHHTELKLSVYAIFQIVLEAIVMNQLTQWNATSLKTNNGKAVLIFERREAEWVLFHCK